MGSPVAILWMECSNGVVRPAEMGVHSHFFSWSLVRIYDDDDENGGGGNGDGVGGDGNTK